jgi:hypothetical protein
MDNVDPMVDKREWVSGYNYVQNNPILRIDPDGAFDTKADAKQYAEDNNIRTGFFSRNKIQKADDGSYAINNRKESTSISNDKDMGITTGALVRAERNGGIQSSRSANFWSTTTALINSFTSPKADLIGGATENKIGQILLDRAKYGKLHPETVIRTPVRNINISTKLLQNSGTALKWGGRAFGAVGLVGTYAQWQTGAIGNTEAALDATFGAIGFFPGYGWAVSGTYFLIAKPLYNYSPKP